MIDQNPIFRLLRVPESLGQQRPTDQLLLKMFRVLADTATWIVDFLRLFEFHVDVFVDKGAETTVKHNLRRRPYGMVILRRDAEATVVTHYEKWTETEIVLEAFVNDVTVAFVLF